MKMEIQKFVKGAVIYIEGSRDVSKFYIVKEGQVKLSRSMEEEVHILKPGDLFGVVSAMSGQPRLESAETAMDSVVIAIPREGMMDLIKMNASIPLKIVTNFSARLRRLDDEITKLGGETKGEKTPDALFEIGERYFQSYEYPKAFYAFKKYLEYCSVCDKKEEAEQRLEVINRVAGQVNIEPVRRSGLEVEYAQGQVIFLEGEPGDEMYIIQEGRVDIVRITEEGKEHALAILKEGDMFGEMALLENKPRSASAIANTDVKLLAVNRENFELMVKTRPELTVKLLHILSNRIWVAYRQLDNLRIPDQKARILDIMLIQMAKSGAKPTPGKPFTFEYGPTEVLKMVGMDPEEGMPLIQELVDQGLIRLEEDGNKIVIPDIEAIEAAVSSAKKFRERKKSQ